jgi:thiamine-monophosphate kinase
MVGRERTVAELGEHALIQRVIGKLAPPPVGDVWAGDDGALLSGVVGGVLITTDVLVEGIDFRLEYASGTDIGFKAVMANASDIAAMGGGCRGAVVALALRPDTPVSLIDDLSAGLATAGEYGGPAIVGGDVTEASELSITVSVVGEPPPSGPVLRSGAIPGQALCVTGSLGGARGGLEVLLRGLSRHGPAPSALAARQLRPVARIEAGPLIAEHGATAMIDLSDGLATDLGHLVEASGVGCAVDPEALPVDEHLDWLAEAVDGFDPFLAAVLGGEDYELLFTIDRDRIERLTQRLRDVDVVVTPIGAITSNEARIGETNLEDWRTSAWEHLRSR